MSGPECYPQLKPHDEPHEEPHNPQLKPRRPHQPRPQHPQRRQQPRRSHQPRPQHPQHPQRRQQPRIPQRPLQEQPAAKGSLRSILLQHSSKRLYVHPIKWTTLHLSLLCCIVIKDQLNAHPRCLIQGLWEQECLDLWKRLRCLKAIGLRNERSRKLIHCLGLNARPDCEIGPGTLALRYNQKPVCHLQLPLMAWNNKALLWAFIDSSWIDGFHQKYKPREHIFFARAKRAVVMKDWLISPFCVAIILAMAQQVTPGQQVTLFLFEHEEKSIACDKVISTFYEYTFQASQTYLDKFDKSYDVFESKMAIHCRAIPLQSDMLNVLSDAVQRAATGPVNQPQTAAHTDREAATIIDSPCSVDLLKRKALLESDSNIVKRVKGDNDKGKDLRNVV